MHSKSYIKRLILSVFLLSALGSRGTEIYYNNQLYVMLKENVASSIINRTGHVNLQKFKKHFEVVRIDRLQSITVPFFLAKGDPRRNMLHLVFQSSADLDAVKFHFFKHNDVVYAKKVPKLFPGHTERFKSD